MKTTRRDFLIKGGFAVAGAALLPGFACSGSKRNRIIALQLYSVRDEMRETLWERSQNLQKWLYHLSTLTM